MPRLALALALLVAACTDPAGRALDLAPLELAKPTLVPLALDDRPIADVVLGNALPRRFLVDTGSDLTLLSTRCARDLGLEPKPYARTFRTIDSTGAEVELGHYVQIDRLRLGDLVVRDCLVTLIDSPALATANVFGIVGQDLLSRVTLALDMRQRALHLAPVTGREAVTKWLTESRIGVGAWATVELNAKPRIDLDGVDAILARERTVHLAEQAGWKASESFASRIPRLRLRVDGVDAFVPLLVDTGASGTTLPREALAALKSTPIGTRMQEGLGGGHAHELHRVDGLDLFGLKFSLDVTAGATDRGLLGMDVWSQLVLVVDGPARMLWLHRRE